tara:strand:- start:1362 stop:1487 length:126 start_codon:yes stop_codon:yes gene_type:complete
VPNFKLSNAVVVVRKELERGSRARLLRDTTADFGRGTVARA